MSKSGINTRSDFLKFFKFFFLVDVPILFGFFMKFFPKTNKSMAEE